MPIRSAAKPGAPSTSAQYTIRESASGSQTVREYVNSGGIVFGVAWKGRAHPDLSKLLGSYFDEFKSQNKNAQRPGHGRGRVRGNHRVLHGSRVVVERFGRMRALSGRAYVLALMPQGMKPNEIR